MEEDHKPQFLAELRAVSAASSQPLLLCGDFNMIYKAQDKNNDRLNLRAMRRFLRTLDDIQVEELFLHGRLYTWSNHRRRPTLERINHAFGNVAWFEAFPDHHLRALSSDCSDHAPLLLLQLSTTVWAKPRFRFETFWVRLEAFQEVVKRSWEPPTANVDACRALDIKLRRTAKAFTSWSRRAIGSLRSQLFMARETTAQLDASQDFCHLSNEEFALRAELKRHTLGLASLARTIAKQRARTRFLGEGDANTKYFHLQACHRNRKNCIPALLHEGTWFSDDEAKSDLIFQYYNDILGMPFQREHTLQLDDLLPRLDVANIDACFTEEEVWMAIKDLPPNRAPGPDGFTGLFYKVAWDTIKADVICAFNALWSLDYMSFYLLNDALMVLLRKTDAPSRLKDYRPISLMHSFSKLFSKCLARRQAPRLNDIVAMTTSTRCSWHVDGSTADDSSLCY